MNLKAVSLPSGLLDLMFSRAYGPIPYAIRTPPTGYAWKRGAHTRRMHQAALAAAQKPPPPPPPLPPPTPAMENLGVSTLMPTLGTGRGRRVRRDTGPLSVRETMDEDGPGFELEKRLQALEVAAFEEETTIAAPSYSETDLMLFYEDLLTIPPKTQPQPQVDREALEHQQAEQDAAIMQEAEQRLSQSYPQLFAQTVDETQHLLRDKRQTYQNVLMRAQLVVTQLESMRELALGSPDSHQTEGHGTSLPVSVLSIKECEALVRVCTKAQDGRGALWTLEIMKQCRMPISENAVTDVLELLATSGNVRATESLIANFITSPTERHRHLHVKAHLKATSPDVIPTSALAVLHSYEEKSLFAPMQTYTSLITTLFSNPSSIARAQAWDLFTHMRYVAHPDPDVLLYTLMIRACASPLTSASEPEKALDFWTEMTVDRRIEPTVGAYNAVILACARSGTKTYVNEAYRLAKEMLDSHRDAHGVSSFRPDRKTFCALLEGAKRIGDLVRARWILAEMIRADPDDPNAPVDAGINEEVMMHLFQTYAAYQPPFKREATLVVQDEKELNDASASNGVEPRRSSSPDVAEETPEPTSNTALALDSAPSFSHIPPQSHTEVLHEITFLFQRILNDTGHLQTPQNPKDFSENILNKFCGVNLTSRLLNSYISVFFRHAPLDVAKSMFWKVFDPLQVPKTARTYVEALERCAYSKKGRDREVAAQFAEELWREWKLVEDSGVDGGKRLSARLIERANIARLRLYSIMDDADSAMRHLRDFAHRYPPSAVRDHSAKLALRSMRTSLVGSRPLVRMTTTTEVPDDSVPPLLTFRDLEVLHHRLVAFEMHKEIGYVKWLAKAYEWMLRVRRDEGFKARPAKEDLSPVEM